MGAIEFLTGQVPDLPNAIARSHMIEASFGDYEYLRDQELGELEASYIWVPRGGTMRIELMKAWGVDSLDQLPLVEELRDSTENARKPRNEKVYQIRYGTYLCHSWHGDNEECDWRNGELEIIKLSPALNIIFQSWLDERPPVSGSQAVLE